METTLQDNSIKYFIYEASTKTEIPIEDAVEINFHDATNLFFKLRPEAGNFIGFLTHSSQVIQFMSLGIANSYLMDIPIPSKNGSLQKTADFEECYAAINSLFNNENGFEVTDMKFKKWKTR